MRSAWAPFQALSHQRQQTVEFAYQGLDLFGHIFRQTVARTLRQRLYLMAHRFQAANGTPHDSPLYRQQYQQTSQRKQAEITPEHIPMCLQRGQILRYRQGNLPALLEKPLLQHQQLLSRGTGYDRSSAVSGTDR